MAREVNIYETEAFVNNTHKIIRPGGLNLTRELIEGLELTGKVKVLDLGCGTGATVELLNNEFGLAACGIDPSETLIQIGKGGLPDLPITVGKGENLPYQDESFDVVLLECSLSTMRDQSKVLKEVSRVLSKGGKLGITDIYLRRDPGDLWQKIGLSTGCLVGATTQQKLEGLLQIHGFEVKHWQDKSPLWRSYIGEMLMGNCSLDLLLGAGVNSCQEKDEILEVIGKTRPGYFLLVAEKTINISE